jgi:hypothetical protein
VPVEMLTRENDQRSRTPASPVTLPTEKEGVRAATRRFWRDRTLRRWLIAWLGAPALAIVNGAARELVYKEQVGESTANQISVAPLIALLTLYFWFLQRRWPLATTRDAVAVGAAWAAMSVLFEFGFGHYVEGDSWSDLARTYDVTAGNLWILIPLWMAAGPVTVRAFCRPGSATASVRHGR